MTLMATEKSTSNTAAYVSDKVAVRCPRCDSPPLPAAARPPFKQTFKGWSSPSRRPREEGRDNGNDIQVVPSGTSPLCVGTKENSSPHGIGLKVEDGAS